MDAGAALRASAISTAFSGMKYRWKGAAAGYGAGLACACIRRVAPGTTTSTRSAKATRPSSFFGMELSRTHILRFGPGLGAQASQNRYAADSTAQNEGRSTHFSFRLAARET